MIELSPFIRGQFRFETGFSLAVFSETTKVEIAERGFLFAGGVSTKRGTRASFRGTECVLISFVFLAVAQATFYPSVVALSLL